MRKKLVSSSDEVIFQMLVDFISQFIVFIKKNAEVGSL